MPTIRIPANNWKPRPYQQKLWNYLEKGGKHAVAVWHRRAGKDELALNRACVAAFERPATYWHMLPEYSQARKAIWDAINPHTGKRRIDEAFPQELRETTREQEMFIKLRNGATWQVVGSDRFNSLVGSPPVGIVYSEWSVANPMAHAYLSPILAENNGWALFIYTARGYNHGFQTYQGAKSDSSAFAELLTADDTGVISQEQLDRQKRTYIELYGPEAGSAVFRQEFYNDFSAANIGAVLGAAIERADKQGRIVDFDYDKDQPVIISSDIGYRDTASWWFWQPKAGGFDLIDYDQGIGMDADDWIERLKTKPYRIGRIWLPHDAKVKTFQSKHSTIERFLIAFGKDKIGIVPESSRADRYNAGRRVAERCIFHRTNCKEGLNGLRSWAFEYDEEKKIYSKEAKHDWASHPGDGYTYGCQVLEELIITKEKKEPLRGVTVGAPSVSLEELYKTSPTRSSRL